jgi:hypothetical protein
MKKELLVLMAVFALLAVAVVIQRRADAAQESGNVSRLAVVWSSGDPDVAHRVCFMYAHNAKKQKWFDEVTLIVWGPSARLLAGDKDLQAEVTAMLKDGIKVEACIACADSYGVTDTLRKLGVDVKPMGKPLTDMLKQNQNILTF